MALIVQIRSARPERAGSLTLFSVMVLKPAPPPELETGTVTVPKQGSLAMVLAPIDRLTVAPAPPVFATQVPVGKTTMPHSGLPGGEEMPGDRLAVLLPEPTPDTAMPTVILQFRVVVWDRVAGVVGPVEKLAVPPETDDELKLNT